MPNVTVYNQLGESVGEIELNDAIFGVEVNEHVIYEVVKNQLANKRQGTQSAKTRAEVRGGGRKPWRQKGTGRARQGSTRSPQWTGGGVIFAPKPRDYSYKTPKKIKRLAMKSILSSKVNDEEMIVLDKLSFDNISTKVAKKVLEDVKAAKKALIVVENKDDVVYKSFRNLAGVEIAEAKNINVYDVIKHDSLVMTQDAVKKIEEVFA
ncbi:50S ribosomal protein L4 [Miniphocaeibacter halophilus]|uniref:50S ribosomal protein L4 n=1 Tax=Miniphocaeibacter halophilus TaxID=2931922 RepID=A0AC61MQ32_9FIRM|nr:50S ribosomal protein L4 [Miniphocaeibacter halophilus]QQK07049.1 50S ribosomal protein L4 [Miniphocaeibacter halophilus]